MNLEELRSDRIGIQTQASLTSKSSDDWDPFTGTRWLVWWHGSQCLGQLSEQSMRWTLSASALGRDQNPVVRHSPSPLPEFCANVLMVQKSFLGAAGTLFIPGSGTEAFDVPWQVGVAWGGLLEPSYPSLALPWDSHL